MASSKKTVGVEMEVELPFRGPEHYDLPIDAHHRWCDLLKKADQLVSDDALLQKKVAHGLRLKERRLPMEVLGRFYCQYCDLINRMYDTFLRCAQVQRQPYMQEIIAVVLNRMYELRNELVYFVVNDYIYVDEALKQLKLTPDDIQIVVPYHFPSESRPQTVEELYKKMLVDARNREIKKLKQQTKQRRPSPTESELALMKELGQPRPEEGQDSEDESHTEESVGSVHTEITEDFIRATMIQKHERFRQYYVRAVLKKFEFHQTYFASKVPPATIKVRSRAAAYVTKMYRTFMVLKRKRLRDDRRDILLGLIPDMQARPLKCDEEIAKVYAHRREERDRVRRAYLERMKREKNRLLLVSKDRNITDITEEIVEWLNEWFVGYEKFPRFPLEFEGGTVLIATGQFPTIEEQIAEDERIRRATQGKTKDQLKEDKIRAKEEAEMRRELEREKLKKEKQNLFKARCNPQTDPGYDPKTSEACGNAVQVLNKYRQSWSIYDKFPVEVRSNQNVVYGFLQDIMVEDLMREIHLECRTHTDELMRLELKVFQAAHKMMCERLRLKYEKPSKPKKPPKANPAPKPFIVDEKIMKNIEKVFDLGIVSKPTTKLNDVIGDLNFAAYENHIADPKVKYPPPGYGDVRRRLVLSCIFGAGMDPGAVRRKSVMLLGQPRNGKSFLADAICGELNALKFNISPEVFTAKVKDVTRMLNCVLQAARLFQPSVIFCKNIQKVFYKKVPPQEVKEYASRMKSAVGKLISGIPATEKVIFIGTCSDPFSAAAKPMCSIFNEIIMVPRADYGSIRKFLYYRFQKIFSMPRDFNVQGLAKTMEGLGFGQVIEVYEKVMTADRICRLNIKPLEMMEFMEYMIENDIEPMLIEDYEKYVTFWVSRSPLKAARAEYDVINTMRAVVFERNEKKKAEDEAKKEKAK